MKAALIFDQARADTTGTYFARAFEALHLEYRHYWLRDLDSVPPGFDWYLRIDHGDDYERPWPDRLRPASFYAIDTHLAHTWKKVRRMSARYDQVFCCHRPAAEALKRAEWIPVACDPVIHAPVPGPKIWDVGFVGTDGGIPRKFYLQALRERYPNSRIGPDDYLRMGRVYSQSRIGFNYGISEDVNMRVFEVLAAGGCLVTNALAHDELQTIGLRDGEHLALYRRGRDVFDRIDALLADPDARARLAQAGRKAVIGAHTYAHRLVRMIELAAELFGWNLQTLAPDLNRPLKSAETSE